MELELWQVIMLKNRLKDEATIYPVYEWDFGTYDVRWLGNTVTITQPVTDWAYFYKLFTKQPTAEVSCKWKEGTLRVLFRPKAVTKDQLVEMMREILGHNAQTINSDTSG